MSTHITLPLFLTLIHTSTALPISSTLHSFQARAASTGAKAGLGIGIAVIILLVVLFFTFFIIHFRRRSHLAAINHERAILSGEKNPDGTDKVDKFASSTVSAVPKRHKSVKDRLMGPLYRGSTIDMLPMPNQAHTKNQRQSTMSFLDKPWAKSGESSPRPSFSSKRATRMMMMM